MYNMLRALWSPAVIGGQPAELEKKAGRAKKLTPDPHAYTGACLLHIAVDCCCHLHVMKMLRS